MRSMVVLPQPEGPSRVMNSPSPKVSLNSWITTLSPKALVTCFMVIVAIVSAPYQMENSPLVRRFRIKFRNTTINRIPNAMAQLMGWLVKVQYSNNWKPMVLVVLE